MRSTPAILFLTLFCLCWLTSCAAYTPPPEVKTTYSGIDPDSVDCPSVPARLKRDPRPTNERLASYVADLEAVAIACSDEVKAVKVRLAAEKAKASARN